MKDKWKYILVCLILIIIITFVCIFFPTWINSWQDDTIHKILKINHINQSPQQYFGLKKWLSLKVSNMSIWITIISVGSSMIFSVISLMITLYSLNEEKKEREKHQANNINCYVDNEDISKLQIKVIINNNTSYPIYDVFIFSSCNNNSLDNLNIDIKNYQYYKQIMPGSYYAWLDYTGRGMGYYQTCVILFRDTNNKYWIKLQEGHIKKISSKKKE